MNGIVENIVKKINLLESHFKSFEFKNLKDESNIKHLLPLFEDHLPTSKAAYQKLKIICCDPTFYPPKENSCITMTPIIFMGHLLEKEILILPSVKKCNILDFLNYGELPEMFQIITDLKPDRLKGNYITYLPFQYTLAFHFDIEALSLQKMGPRIIALLLMITYNQIMMIHKILLWYKEMITMHNIDYSFPSNYIYDSKKDLSKFLQETPHIKSCSICNTNFDLHLDKIMAETHSEISLLKEELNRPYEIKKEGNN